MLGAGPVAGPGVAGYDGCRSPAMRQFLNHRTIQSRVRAMADPSQAAVLARFFKTGPGEYGEGDVFVGVRVPVLRKLAKECRALPLKEAERLLGSAVHEERLVALLIWVFQAAHGEETDKRRIYGRYLARAAKHINNWDLVDLSAPQLVGAYLRDKSHAPLDRLARSKNLWERRISILATLHFIRNGQFDDTLRIAERLLGDGEDLIHKAVGWMLREVGKRNQRVLERFLRQHHAAMPRTMLRYAIERLPEQRRQMYLTGTCF